MVCPKKNINKKLRFHSSLTHSRSGFSLTELLVVIFLITVFLGIGGLSLTKNNNAQGLNTALATVDSLIFEARDLAIKSGFNTRLVIDNNSASAGFRRDLVIAKADATGAFTATSRVVKLPKGIYVDNTGKSIGGVANLGNFTASVAVAYGSAGFPANQGIEFNPLGICIDSSIAGSTSGANLVLVKFPDPTALPTNNATDQDAGIVIWRNGSTTKVTDSSTIQ